MSFEQSSISFNDTKTLHNDLNILHSHILEKISKLHQNLSYYLNPYLTPPKVKATVAPKPFLNIYILEIWQWPGSPLMSCEFVAVAWSTLAFNTSDAVERKAQEFRRGFSLHRLGITSVWSSLFPTFQFIFFIYMFSSYTLRCKILYYMDCECDTDLN